MPNNQPNSFAEFIMHRLTNEHPPHPNPARTPTPPPQPVSPQAYHQPPPSQTVPPQTYHQPPPRPLVLPAPAPPPSLLQHATVPRPVNVEWSSGICAYCSDIPICCITCWCPCITFGQIAEIVDKGSTSCEVQGAIYAAIEALTGCACIYSAMYRSKMRNQLGLRESPCNDYLLHICCERRALCQEYRELKHRGFDLSIGWQVNMAGQNHGVQMPPMSPNGMHR